MIYLIIFIRYYLTYQKNNIYSTLLKKDCFGSLAQSKAHGFFPDTGSRAVPPKGREAWIDPDTYSDVKFLVFFLQL